MTQSGYLVLIDLSGYTAFSVSTRLDEGVGILKSLLGTLAEHIQPPLRIAEIEGDAVFAYALEGSFRNGQTLLEVIEQLYCVFAAAREQMQHNATCECTGCRLIPGLDAKIVAHYGEFVLTNLVPGQPAKPTGPAVILAHRLLKNRVLEVTGIQSYAFITRACSDSLGLDWLQEQAIPHTERYEHVGSVDGYVHDLSPAWERYRASRSTAVDSSESWLDVGMEIPATSQEVWDVISTPAFRGLWHHANRVELSAGRTGPGAEFRCFNGQIQRIDRIVQWRPFHQMTLDCEWALGARVRVTLNLAAAGQGTRVTARLSRPEASGGVVLRSVSAAVHKLRRRRIERECHATLSWLENTIIEQRNRDCEGAGSGRLIQH